MGRMNLDTVVKRGEVPWRPSPDASDCDAWLVWDHPRAGTFRIGQDLVLFTVVSDNDDADLSVWAYAPVQPEAERSFADAWFASSSELGEFISAHFADQMAVFVVASDLSIAHWGEYRVPDGADGLATAAAAFVSSLIAAAAPSTRLQAALAGAAAVNAIPEPVSS
jgi:hypothetical protein